MRLSRSISLFLLLLGSESLGQTTALVVNPTLSRCVRKFPDGAVKLITDIPQGERCYQATPAFENSIAVSNWNDRLFERGTSNSVGAADGPREVTGRYDVDMRRCGDLPATQECPYELRARFTAVCPDPQAGLTIELSTGARTCARAQDIRVRTALVQVFDVPGIPRLVTPQTNNDSLVPIAYASILASNGSAAEVCAAQSDGPTPEEQYGNPAFNPIHAWIVISVSPGGQPVCGRNPSAKAVSELQKATCQSEKARVLRDGGAVSPDICTNEEDQIVVLKLVNRQHTAQDCRALGAASFLVDPASATTALHSVGVSGNTTKICTYTGAPSGIQNFNNTSCDSQTGSGVVEVTRENVDQFNNRFFCGVSFSETTSPPARPSGWEFFQNWTVSVPPGPVSAPYPHSGELPVACAGNIDWSCRNAISAPPETSPEVGRSCKSSIILMPGGIYATSDSGLIQPAVIYQQELVTLGATSNWFNGAPPVRSFQSSKRQGNGVGCSNNAPFCQSVGSLQQCRARQRGYGVY